MTLGDRIFGGSSISPSAKYIASGIGAAVSLFVAVFAWFIPAEDLEAPAGKWVISFIGLAMFAFAIYASRHFRKQLRSK